MSYISLREAISGLPKAVAAGYNDRKTLVEAVISHQQLPQSQLDSLPKIIGESLGVPLYIMSHPINHLKAGYISGREILKLLIENSKRAS